ncbi:hypothetical protein DSM106972_070920 [Dulcicalothrix desertica PCC 7102]|uniref:Cytochrome c domain-containing protein n=2 Tax=Dulcicalothrix desertica TaxID=32056 RepID=A0A433V4R7_9CYAN|nr:hypothetical protein DSM106972_070920 [Dulcicalothrix desertica PCC 7102]
MVVAGQTVSAQLTGPAVSTPLTSLKTVRIPEPDNINDFIRNKAEAIALGKTLFWDVQVGSDGVQSCASCHFHAGADNRSENQIHPGADNNFNTGGRPNYQLAIGDYPFHKLADPNNRASTVMADSNDVTGSQGVHLTKFNDIIPGSPQDNVTVQPDPVFNVQNVNVRQVTGRNAPSVINAVFNDRNFWDGRAQSIFNGVNPFGSRDPNAFVLKSTRKQQPPQEVKISLNNSSLASQAVGPPLSSVEESGTNRILPDVGQKFNPKLKSNKLSREIGKKLKSLRPLGQQLIHPEDSVLGKLSRWPNQGIKDKSYEAMVQDAFKPEWWDSQYIVKIGDDGKRRYIRQPQGPRATDEFSMMDYNFSLFMGLAIQMYESTLVSDEAPIDKFLEGNSNALTAQQKLGLEIFQNKGKCINCHGGAEFTNASVRNVNKEKIERMTMGNDKVAVYDNGFYNIGVRPTQEDIGVGDVDPFGKPLSLTKLTQETVALGKILPPIIKASPGENISDAPLSPYERAAVDGAFKTPGLRNIDLTAPYFHNGGALTLRQVVDFYNRGGDFHEENIDNLDADIENLNLTEQEKDALVAFMRTLTDERVRLGRAPFDHPQLFIPNGHQGNQNSVINDGTGKARDELVEIPAVGRNGGEPLPNFLGN